MFVNLHFLNRSFADFHGPTTICKFLAEQSLRGKLVMKAGELLWHFVHIIDIWFGLIRALTNNSVSSIPGVAPAGPS